MCPECEDRQAQIVALTAQRDAIQSEIDLIRDLMDGKFRTGSPGSTAERVYRFREKVRDLVRGSRIAGKSATREVDVDVLHDVARLLDGAKV